MNNPKLRNLITWLPIEETVRDLMIQYVNPEIGIFLSKQAQEKQPVGQEK